MTTDSDSDEEIPELEDASASAGAASILGPSATGLPIDVSKAKQSRGEKKARKIMSKLGLKPVSVILMVMIMKKVSILLRNLFVGTRSKSCNHT